MKSKIDNVELLIPENDTKTFLISQDGSTLYERFLGEEIREHSGRAFLEMSDDELTDYIIDANQD